MARQVPAVLVASERVAVGARGPAHSGGGSWEASPPSFPSSVSVCSSQTSTFAASVFISLIGSRGLRVRKCCLGMPPLSPSGLLTLGKRLCLSEPQFTFLKR